MVRVLLPRDVRVVLLKARTHKRNLLELLLECFVELFPDELLVRRTEFHGVKGLLEGDAK